MMKRVIVTGATGFIGGALTKKLLENGVTVYGVGRSKEKLAELEKYGDFQPVCAEFEDYDKLDTLIKERGFDWFYHLAWRGTSTKDYDNYNDYNVQIFNIKITCDAAVAAARLECSKSSTSSSYQQANVAINKQEHFNPILYGTVKRCAGELFKAIACKNGMPCVNLIFPNTYGPGDKENTAIMFFIKSLLQNKPLNLISGQYPDDWMSVDELVEGIIAASNSSLQYGDYYIGHRRITTFKEKLTDMKRVLCSDSVLNFGVYPENYYVDYSKFDLEALFRDTGWEAKAGFADTIGQTAAWIKTEKPTPPPNWNRTANGKLRDLIADVYLYGLQLSTFLPKGAFA
jgi:nucleoside-diphosphate-sugar epimerase